MPSRSIHATEATNFEVPQVPGNIPEPDPADLLVDDQPIATAVISAKGVE